MAQLVVRVSGLAVTATSSFRVDAQTHALVVVKAEVAFEASTGGAGPVLVAPTPIDPARDLAPYLPTAQILLAPPRGAASEPCRMVVGRGARVLVDVVGPLDALARPTTRDPRAAALLAAMAPGKEPPHVERGFDWSALFEAPPERRLDALRGDEWIQLGGARTLALRIPPVRAEARLHGTGALRKGRPLALCCDTLRIDVDAAKVAFLWRASLPADLQALDGLRVAVGVAMGAEAIPWTDPFAEPAAVAAKPKPAGSKHEGTVVSEEANDEVARARRMLDALKPFTSKPAAAPAPAAPAPRPAPAPPPAAPAPPAPAARPDRETTADVLSIDLARKPATPFEKAVAAIAPPPAPPATRPAAPARGHPLEGTLDLDRDAAHAAAATPPVPFAGVANAPSPARRISSAPPPPGAPFRPVAPPPPAEVAPLAPAIAPAPPPPAAPPALVSFVPDAAASLGSAYLAAARAIGREDRRAIEPHSKRSRLRA